MSTDTVSLLHDTHILVLMADKKIGKTVSRVFESMGATIHTATTQNEAIGLYWRLFRSGIRPRAVVTSWSLTPQDSEEYKYLELLGRQEVDGTALNLLVNITDLDPTAFLIVYTEDPMQASHILNKNNINAEVFCRNMIEPVDFAVRIAAHPGISKQRVSFEQINEEVQSREKTRRQNTRSSAEVCPLAHCG